MKTPTLIVRLVSLYLVFSSLSGLLLSHRMQAMAGSSMPGLPIPQNPVLDQAQAMSWILLILGVGGVALAGPVARLLTFDSEPRGKSADLSEQLLGRNG